MGLVHHAEQDPVSGLHRCSRCSLALPSNCTPGLFVEHVDGEREPSARFRQVGVSRDGLRLCAV